MRLKTLDTLAAVFCFGTIALFIAVTLFGCRHIEPIRDVRGCTGIEPGTCLR